MRREGLWRRVLAWLAFAALRLVGRTLRLREAAAPLAAVAVAAGAAGAAAAASSVAPAQAGAARARRVLLAFEHGRQFALLAWFDRQPAKRIALLSSTSDDGRLQAAILRRLGYRVVLGSSSRRGAAALVGLLRAVRDDGYDAALAVDGPRGPRGSVKPGIAWLAARTGAEIVPVSAAAAPAHVFARSWCAYRLPWPWARGRVAFGAPITVARDAGEADIARACAEVGGALARLGAAVDGAAGVAPVVPAARDVLDWTG